MSFFELIWDLDQDQKIEKLIQKVESQEERIEVLEGWIRYLEHKINGKHKLDLQ